MKTYNEFENSIHISEDDIAKMKLNEDRLQKELLKYCDTIKNKMKNKNWQGALDDTKNLVDILAMVI